MIGACTWCKAFRKSSTSLVAVLCPLGEGDRTIALQHFKQFMTILVGVATGLVEGVSAPTTPTGRAISMIPVSEHSAITPTLFAIVRSRNNPMVFR